MGMNVAHCEDMRSKRLELLLLVVILAAVVCILYVRPLMGESVDEVAVVKATRALPETSPSITSVAPIQDPERVTSPDAAIEVRTPVQSLAEREDAMLFECEALLGTPFDQAIVAPFD
jgi:hypothetical protein